MHNIQLFGGMSIILVFGLNHVLMFLLFIMSVESCYTFCGNTHIVKYWTATNMLTIILNTIYYLFGAYIYLLTQMLAIGWLSYLYVNYDPDVVLNKTTEIMAKIYAINMHNFNYVSSRIFSFAHLLGSIFKNVENIENIKKSECDMLDDEGFNFIKS